MAFIGFKVNNYVSKLFCGLDLPGDLEPEHKMHITLICFDKDFTIDHVAKITKPLFELFSKEKSVNFKINTISSFDKYEDNPIPIIAVIDSKEIIKLHEKTAKLMDELEIGYYDNFKFNPHMTLAYDPEDKKFTDIKIDDILFNATEAVLWVGDYDDNGEQLTITFPFKNLVVKSAEFMCDAFEKIASRK
jgi:2'-5' RNA ligase